MNGASQLCGCFRARKKSSVHVILKMNATPFLECVVGEKNVFFLGEKRMRSWFYLESSLLPTLSSGWWQCRQSPAIVLGCPVSAKALLVVGISCPRCVFPNFGWSCSGVDVDNCQNACTVHTYMIWSTGPHFRRGGCPGRCNPDNSRICHATYGHT